MKESRCETCKTIIDGNSIEFCIDCGEKIRHNLEQLSLDIKQPKPIRNLDKQFKKLHDSL